MDVKSVRSDEQETQAGQHTSGTAPAVLEPPQLSRLGRGVTVMAVVQACGMAAAVVAAIFLFFLLGCKMSAFEAWTHLALVCNTLLGYGVLLLAMLAWNSRFCSTLRAPTAMALVLANGVAAGVLAAIFLFFLLGCQMSAFEAWKHMGMVCNTLLGYGVLLLAILAWISRFCSTLRAPRAMALVLANGLAAAVLAAIFLFFLLGCQMSAFEAWKHMGMVGQILFCYAALAGATFAARTWYGHAA
ncbi:hypothetical protein ACK3TF_000434 [Chlorella vulgaris]